MNKLDMAVAQWSKRLTIDTAIRGSSPTSGLFSNVLQDIFL